MNILIIGTCTSSKKHTSKPTPAWEVYEGMQHQYIVQGWNKLKDAFKGSSNKIDYYIISAKYGLINSNTKITSYNRTFAGKSADKIQKMSQDLGIDRKLKQLIPKYDLIFWMLSDPYMEAIQGTLEEINNFGETTNVFFIPSSALDDYPTIEDEDYVTLDVKDTKKYKAGLVMLKGKYFLILADILTKDVPTEASLKKIKSNPEYIEDLVKKYWKKDRVLESIEKNYAFCYVYYWKI